MQAAHPDMDIEQFCGASGNKAINDVITDDLKKAGLLSLPHPEEFGGYGQPYEVYLQVVEEVASAWMSVAVGVSVHSLTAYPVTTFGTPEQQAALLPGMLSGEQLGAFLAHPAVQDLPAVMETPGPDDHGPDAAEMQKLRDLHTRWVKPRRRVGRGATRSG